MRYYEHHLGDYLRDTAHLTMLEDGAYRRLLDAYYSREKPLPANKAEVCKLARAVSKEEKSAVLNVLKEFFALADDGYRQPRADAEIAHFAIKREKAKASANSRWRSGKGSVNDANALRTQCDGNALQSPITNHQTKDLLSSSWGDLSPSSLSSQDRDPLKGVIRELAKSKKLK